MSPVGRWFAREVVERHPGAWEIPFRCDNLAAGVCWRRVAAELWGDAWVESEEPIPAKPHLPPDHWIRSSPSS